MSPDKKDNPNNPTEATKKPAYVTNEHATAFAAFTTQVLTNGLYPYEVKIALDLAEAIQASSPEGLAKNKEFKQAVAKKYAEDESGAPLQAIEDSLKSEWFAKGVLGKMGVLGNLLAEDYVISSKAVRVNRPMEQPAVQQLPTNARVSRPRQTVAQGNGQQPVASTIDKRGLADAIEGFDFSNPDAPDRYWVSTRKNWAFVYDSSTGQGYFTADGQKWSTAKGAESVVLDVLGPRGVWINSLRRFSPTAPAMNIVEDLGAVTLEDAKQPTR